MKKTDVYTILHAEISFESADISKTRDFKIVSIIMHKVRSYLLKRFEKAISQNFRYIFIGFV